MPENTRRINDKSNAQTPGLERRRLWSVHTETGWQVEFLYMVPPRIKVVDHELHHEICRPFLLEAVLENEAARTNAKNCHIAIEQLFKTEYFIEAFTQSEISGRQKWPGELTA